MKTHLAAAAGAVIVALFSNAAMSAPGFDIMLTPVPNAAGKVQRVEVFQRIEGAAGKPLELAVAIRIFGDAGIADRITGLEVRDTQGAVAFQIADEEAMTNGQPYSRRWKAKRAVSWPVTVRYSAGIQPDHSPRGPPYGLRPAGAGVAAMGSGFLLLPVDPGTTINRLSWDLSALPAGSIGVISAGEGATTLEGSPQQLDTQWMMAGPMGRYADPNGLPFTGYWLGKPPFDPNVEIPLGAKGYAALAKHFRYLDPPPPYRLFVKVVDAPPAGGGSAGPGGFLMSMTETFSVSEPRVTFFHEMAHQWVGEMQDDGADTGWFAEGYTEYVTITLPVKYGLHGPDAYLKGINNIAKDYYTSKGAKLSMAAIQKVGFADEEIRQTPYNRGALYFAQLDALMRTKSGGKRNVDSVLLPMLAARAKGTPMTVASWESAIQKELGAHAVAEFRAEVIEGTKVIVPTSGAFGPCLRRVDVQMTSNSDGSKITGYQWERIAGVADERCGQF